MSVAGPLMLAAFVLLRVDLPPAPAVWELRRPGMSISVRMDFLIEPRESEACLSLVSMPAKMDVAISLFFSARGQEMDVAIFTFFFSRGESNAHGRQNNAIEVLLATCNFN